MTTDRPDDRDEPDLGRFIEGITDPLYVQGYRNGYKRAEAERDELEHRLACLLCELTGNRMSKTNYDVHTMVCEVEAYFERTVDDEVAELQATIDRVRALHREVAIYAYDDTNGVFKQDANGEHIRVESICAECSSDDAIEAVENCEWSADWGHHEIAWPCDTIRALDGAGEQQ